MIRPLAPLSISAALLAAPALSSAALAQTNYSYEAYHLAPGVTLPSGNTARIVAGNFTGAGVRDVACVRGTSAVLYTAPEFLKLASTIETDVTDIATLAGGAADGLDAIVLATTTGLKVQTRSRYSFDAQPTTTWIGDSSWNSATSLAVVDFNQDGLLDLVGLNSAGSAVLRLQRTSTGWTSASSITVSGASVVVPLDFNSDATMDYAVLAGTTLSVLSASGSSLYSWSGTAAPSGLSLRVAAVRISESGTTRNRLLWITGDGSGGQLMRLLKPSSEEQLALGTVLASGVVAADDNGDGLDELLISTQGTSTGGLSLLMVNASGYGGAAFQYALTFLVNHAGGTDSSEASTPCFADLDGDGDREGIVQVRSAEYSGGPTSRHLLMVRNSGINEAAIRPAIPVTSNGGNDVYYYTSDQQPLPNNQCFVKCNVKVASSVPSAATHLEMSIWWMKNSSTPTLQRVDIGDAPARVALPSGSSSLSAGSTLFTSVGTYFELPSHYNAFDYNSEGSTTYIVARYIVQPSGDHPTKRYPAMVVAQLRLSNQQSEAASTSGQTTANKAVDIPTTAPISSSTTSTYWAEIYGTLNGNSIGAGSTSGSVPVPQIPRNLP